MKDFMSKIDVNKINREIIKIQTGTDGKINFILDGVVDLSEEEANNNLLSLYRKITFKNYFVFKRRLNVRSLCSAPAGKTS